MDEQLGNLKRVSEAEPGDEAAFRAYFAALLRSGQRDEAEASLRRRFACPAKFDEMAVLDFSGWVRKCEACSRTVVRVELVCEVDWEIEREGKQCVAIPSEILDEYVKSRLDAPLPPAGTCLLESNPPPPCSSEDDHFIGTIIGPPSEPEGFLKRTWRRVFG